MNKYDKNLGHYFLKERLNEVFFDYRKIIEKEKQGKIYRVSVLSQNIDELENFLELSKLYFVVNYPGLLIGTGTKIEFTNKELDGKISNYKVGLNFDYTSGLPYIPGSSLKGTLRNFFPSEKDILEVREAKTDIINGILKKDYSVEDVIKLSSAIFEGVRTTKKLEDFLPMNRRDKFIEGKILISKDTTVLEKDYITPHLNILKDPVPIQILKINPGTKMEILFELHDSDIDGVTMSKKEKEVLFEEILYLTGLGAKTNTGYGHFNREEAEELKRKKKQEEAERQKEIEKQKQEEERKKLEEKKAGMSKIERFEFEFSSMNKEEKKEKYKPEIIENFEDADDRKKAAKLYYDFFLGEKQTDKTKKKVQYLKGILEN